MRRLFETQSKTSENPIFSTIFSAKKIKITGKKTVKSELSSVEMMDYQNDCIGRGGAKKGVDFTKSKFALNYF